jgi:hypothetical protein
VIVRTFALALAIGGSIAVAQDAAETATHKSRVPTAEFSDQHQEMIEVGVGAEFPELSLPPAAQPSDEAQVLSAQYGAKATVVAVVTGESAMAKTLLRDLQYDVAQQYPVDQGQPPQVATLAIATGTKPGVALEQATKAKYDGPLLLDEQQTAFEQLGSGRLPRVYVLNAQGQIVWFDIEYSLSTRRELKQAVRALAGKPTAQ